MGNGTQVKIPLSIVSMLTYKNQVVFAMVKDNVFHGPCYVVGLTSILDMESRGFKPLDNPFWSGNLILKHFYDKTFLIKKKLLFLSCRKWISWKIQKWSDCWRLLDWNASWRGIPTWKSGSKWTL